jgi:hypothetical protein
MNREMIAALAELKADFEGKVNELKADFEVKINQQNIKIKQQGHEIDQLKSFNQEQSCEIEMLASIVQEQGHKIDQLKSGNQQQDCEIEMLASIVQAQNYEIICLKEIKITRLEQQNLYLASRCEDLGRKVNGIDGHLDQRHYAQNLAAFSTYPENDPKQFSPDSKKELETAFIETANENNKFVHTNRPRDPNWAHAVVTKKVLSRVTDSKKPRIRKHLDGLGGKMNPNKRYRHQYGQESQASQPSPSTPRRSTTPRRPEQASLGDYVMSVLTPPQSAGNR